MIATVLGTIVPVLAYGVLCAVLGAWAYVNYLDHWRR